MVNNRKRSIKLNVVIVSYNSTGTILDAIESLYPLVEDNYLCVTVVDNHGNDGVVKLLEQKASWVEVIQMSQNLGFGSGCNFGFYAKEAEYTLFLNPDAIIKANALLRLVEFLDEHPNAAAVAPAIIEGENLQLAGLMPKPIFWNAKPRAMYQPEVIVPNESAFKTSWLCGAVFLVRSNYFMEVGCFDSNFFLYFEETDLCRRLLERGYDLWANGNVLAEHIGGGSVKDNNILMVSGCIAEHFYKSQYYYFKKHYGLLAAITHDVCEPIFLALRAVKGLLKGKMDTFTKFKVRIQSPFFSEPNNRG